MENFLHIAGPNDIVEVPWGRVPDIRPAFDDYQRQNIGTVLAMPQRLFGTNISPVGSGVGDIFNLLMATPRYTKALASFDGIRGTIVLRINLRSAVTTYGLGMAYWCYGQSRAGVTIEEVLDLASSTHAQVFDLPSCPEIIMRIPYLQPREFLPKDYLEYASFGIMNLSINSLDPAIPSSVYYEAWAHMEDVEVTRYVEAQSMPVAVRQQEFQIPGRVNLPLVAAGAGAAASVGNLIVSNLVTEGYSSLKRSLFQEAYTAVKNEVKSAVRSKVHDSLKQTQKQDQVVASNCQTPVYNAPWGNVNSIQPTYALQDMTEMPLYKINPGLFGDDEFHSLEDMVQNAIVFDITSFTSASLPYRLDLSAVNLRGYAGYISRHFRFFRGRPRIGLFFPFSPLMSARLTVRIGPPGHVYTSNESDSSMPIHTLLVKGSTFHILEVPYNQDTPIFPTESDLFSLQVELINKGEPTTAGYDFPIPMVVFTSFGPGTQFFSVKHPDLASLPIEAQASVRHINRSEPNIVFATSALQPVEYMPEVTTVEELCSRWCSHLGNAKAADNTRTPLNSPFLIGRTYARNSLYGDNVHHFIPLYTLWRGSRDFRVVPDKDLTTLEKVTMSGNAVTSTFSDQSIANGGFIITAETPHQFRVPFLTKFKALSGLPSALDTEIHDPIPPSNFPLTAATTLIARASPDFQLFHLNGLYEGYNTSTFYVPI